MIRPPEPPIDWERLERLFDELAPLRESERAVRIELLRSGESALAHELESLLASAAGAERFFRQLPQAVGAAASDLIRSAPDPSVAGAASEATAGELRASDHPGRVVAQYHVGEQLGRGGMGVVYRAWDTRLKRTVALKFLPPHLWVDRAARERLLLEARAVAALDHPNICTVHEAGETPAGALFLAMACYEGETLRDRLARGPLAVDDAIDIAAQTARALGAAHARGIVHRDVKPGNLMLTPDGSVKLLDFGLARLPDATVSAPGRTPGTVAYMSPEQVLDAPIDEGTDLWALGVVLFEMLTGRRPFRGDSQAAVLHAIVQGDPVAPSRIRESVPRWLDEVVARLLCRDRKGRPASATELLDELQHRGRNGRRPVSREVPRAGREALLQGAARWSLRQRYSVLTGVVLAVVGVVTSARVPARHSRLGSPPMNVRATTGERLLIADFSAPDDGALGADISQGLRMGLAQSSALRVVGATTVSRALRRMRRAPDAPLDSGVAREVAVREGIKAVIQGEVRRRGRGFLIAAALEDATTGDRIEGWRVSATDSAAIPGAIDRLIADIRRGGAESLAGIDSAERVSRLTTSSLGALRKVREGLQAMMRDDFLGAHHLFEEATALDSDFAIAHSLLGTSLLMAGVKDIRVPKAYQRAYELRDRLTESERHAVVALHAKHVLGDLRTTIDAFRRHIAVTRGTGSGIWYSSLADALVLRGEFREAEEVLQEARRVFPTPANQKFLADLLQRRGEDSAALAVLDEATSARPRQARLVVARAFLEARSGDYAKAHAIIDTGLTGPGARQAPRALATLDATRGRRLEALRHLRELHEDDVARGLVFEAANVAGMIGMLRLRIDGAQAAVSEVERRLSALPGSAADRFSYPYHAIALFFATAGHPRRAAILLDEYRQAVPTELRGPDRWLEHRTRAAIRLAERRPHAALAELRTAASEAPLHVGPFDLDYVPIADHPELARVYDRLGMADSALAVYERYLARRDLDRIDMDAIELGEALRRAAELHAVRGELLRAGDCYARLAELWRDADPVERSVAARAAARVVALRKRTERPRAGPR